MTSNKTFICAFIFTLSSCLILAQDEIPPLYDYDVEEKIEELEDTVKVTG